MFTIGHILSNLENLAKLKNMSKKFFKNFKKSVAKLICIGYNVMCSKEQN